MSHTQTSAPPITELKASAHLMLLDPGVFCVFNTPGGQPADSQTGLPSVRISCAPAGGGLAGEVTISAISGVDGWLTGSDGAALVRVAGGPAQILVTVYQSRDGGHEPPKLQVLRLTEPPPAQGQTRQALAPQAQPQPAPSAQGSAQGSGQASGQASGQGPLEVAAHIYGRGDVAGRLGEWMGERGSKRWVEGFGLQPARVVPPSDIEYQAVLGRGWLSPWAEGGQFCGSRGMSLPILGLRVRLKGASAQAYSVVVAATFVDGTEVGPVTDGEACEAPSLAALEAFIVLLQPKQAARAAAPARAPQPQLQPQPAQFEPQPEPSVSPPRRTQPAKSAVQPAPASKPPSKRAAKPAPNQAAKPAGKPGRKR